MGKRSQSSSTKQNPKRKSLAAVKEQPKAKKPAPKKAAAPAAKSNKKDPNLPKKPATAFFVFLEDFRKTYKRDHPNVKGVAVIGKAGGDKWKGMSDEEKAPFLSKAAKRKADYDKDLEAYNNKKNKGGKKEEEDEAENSPDESEEKGKADEDDGPEEDESEEDDDDE